MEATGQIYGFSSSFPSRFGTIFAAIGTFINNEEWLNYMKDLEEVYKKTGRNEMGRPVAKILAVSVTGIIGLILLALVCTVCWTGRPGWIDIVLIMSSFNIPSRSS